MSTAPWIAAAEAVWPGLARPGPRSLRPRAHYANGPPGSVLVLQTGPNASVDYYLRPRLEAEPSRPWAIVDLAASPEETPLLKAEGVWVVICRYIDARWLQALRERPNLSGVAFFVDDDLPAMMTEPNSPLEARLKVSLRYERFIDDLEAVVSEVWVSTPALAHRFETAPRRLDPLPFDAPRPPRREEPPLVVYHGTLTHGAERTFLRQVARLLEGAPDTLRLEIAGGVLTRLDWAPIRKATVRPQRPWRRYLREQRSRGAAILLAPLTDGAVNRARAPVKVFDAARLGAVGLYADRAPYAGVVADGVDGRLLPMDPAVWAAATLDLLRNPEERFGMAQAAFEKAQATRAAAQGLFESLRS